MNLAAETNHALGWAPAGSAAQVTPTSPEILDAGIPEGRRGATAGASGDWALLPIIVVRFHRSTITVLGKWNLQHRRCPALHLLPPIVGRGVPGKGGAIAPWLVVPLLVLEGLVLDGLVLAGLVLAGLVVPWLVLGGLESVSARGRAPAAARVARARAEMILNCMLLCFFVVIPNTEYWGLFDNEESR